VIVRFLIPYSLILVPYAWQLDPSGPRYIEELEKDRVRFYQHVVREGWYNERTESL
jgi:hypothetical protein